MTRFDRTLRTALLAGILPAALSLPAFAQSFQPVRYADEPRPTPSAKQPARNESQQPRERERLWPLKDQQPAGRYVRSRTPVRDDREERSNSGRVTHAAFQTQPGERPDVRHVATHLRKEVPREFAPAMERRSEKVTSERSRESKSAGTHLRRTSRQQFVPAVTERRPMQQRVQPAQHIGGGGKPLPREILAMPKVRETLDVVHHRSQLLIARGNIVRTAIADDSVIDIVQFSPREISIIGIGLGSTTLTIWFDNNPNPLIYLVKTISDPDVDEQLRLDYGRLERKISALFPNSKVYLIPLSGKIVVKGQARDAREAAMILQIVRNEVINQNGSLFGPQPVGAVAVTAAGPGGIARGGLPGPRPYPGSQAGSGPYGPAAGVYSPFDLASSYIVNMLEVPGEFQVMLRVRIAELNRSQLQRMGVDFSYLFNNGRHAVSYALGGIPSTITGIFENGEISVLIDWLSSNGTAKILSEPVITVLSGHTASMLSGGEFAVPTIVGIGGAQGQQTTFRGFGTSLFVTPTVTDRDLIRMTIIPEFSSINQGNAVNGIPGVDARRVQTTVELREGQTIAIAGLIAHHTSTEVARIPFLSDLPYIGPTLFAAKRSTMEETELLILVTPQLVRPMDADEVPPVPGWYVTPPAEHPLYFKAVTEGPPDLEYYQLAPYGRGAGTGEPVGYRLHNPSPATPGYPPAVTDPYGAARSGLPGGIPDGNGQPPRPPHHTAPHNQTMPRQYIPNHTSPPQPYHNFTPPPEYQPPPAGQFQNPQQPVPDADPSAAQPRRSLGNLSGLGR